VFEFADMVIVRRHVCYSGRIELLLIIADVGFGVAAIQRRRGWQFKVLLFGASLLRLSRLCSLYGFYSFICGFTTTVITH